MFLKMHSSGQNEHFPNEQEHHINRKSLIYCDLLLELNKELSQWILEIRICHLFFAFVPSHD